MNIFLLILKNNKNGKDEVVFADNYTPTGKGVWISFDQLSYDLVDREIKDIKNIDVDPNSLIYNSNVIEIYVEKGNTK